jgi:DNA helicase-2/ATP-dependent DNA helicase PcrA
MSLRPSSGNGLLDAGLNPAQLQAVTHGDGPLLILAGPGSGKTRVITHRIAWLLSQGIAGRQIVGLTFTNKAADEMRQRVASLVPRSNVWVGTFHRFCARLLRLYAPQVGLSENYSILDVEDSRRLLAEAILESEVDLSHTTPEAIAQEISWAKNHLMRPEEYVPRRTSHLAAIVARVYPAYQRRLLAANAADFDDLLLHAALLLKENPELRRDLDARYRYILVDEYQDTNFAQYAIVRALSIDYPNLTVTGDPDQSIYGWRGANLSNILDFERDFPQVKVVRLEQNYRSTQAILAVADTLIQHNQRRKPKRLFTDNPPGAPVRLIAYPTQHDEAEDIAARIAQAVRQGQRRPRDFAIFYRTNALSRGLEHALREQGLPYQLVHGLEFYQRKEVKDVLAYLQLVHNPRNDAALLRVINTPARGIGRSTLERLRMHAQRRGLCLLDAAREAGLVEGLSKKAATAVARFVALIDQLGTHVHQPLRELMEAVLDLSDYREVLQNSESEEEMERLANIEELLTVASEFDVKHPEGGGLERFLEETSLVSDTDAWQSEADHVTLMTLHAAKGLEFPVVYIVACEQGLLPHERSRFDEEKLEEERRLLFVGITRAREELQLSYAQYRAYRGQFAPTIPSGFLMELPREQMKVVDHQPAAALDDDDEGFADADESEEGFGDEDAPAWGSADGLTDEDADVCQVPPEEAQPTTRRRQRRRLRPGKRSLTSPVVTGAELLSRRSQDTEGSGFQVAMEVEHPQYGRGVITALEGLAPRQLATVFFYAEKQSRTFRLDLAPLAPVSS